MRIVKNTDGRVAAIRRLAVTMVNMEHGAVVYGKDGMRLHPPHEPFPVVKTSPTTTRGFPREYHLRPTVGIVYFLPGHGLTPSSLASQLRETLAVYGTGHLTGYRIVEAAPCATLRHTGARGRVVDRTDIVGPRGPYVRAGQDGTTQFPARMILFTGADYDGGLPQYVSYKASFTWVITTLGLAFEIGEIKDFRALNALVASVLYDDANMCALEDGSTINRQPAWGDFHFQSPPPCGTSQMARDALSQRVILLDPAAVLGARTSFPQETGQSQAEYGGAVVLAPHCGAQRAEKSALEKKYAYVPWETVAADTGHVSCLMCGLPLWGDVFALRRIAVTPEWQNYADLGAASPRSGPVGGVPGRGPHLWVLGSPERAGVLCRFCFEAIEDVQSLLEMGVEVIRSRVNTAQGVALSRVPSLISLAELVRHDTCRRLRGVPGTYVLAEKGIDRLVLVCEHCLSGKRYLAYPAVVSSGLPVVTVPRIAELVTRSS